MTPERPAASVWHRWNGERWLVVGTWMFRISRRGEGKRLTVTRTFARFVGSAPPLGDWRRKQKPDGGQIHG